MCLAIPGRVVEIVDEAGRIAKVEVGGVRRNVNVALLDAVGVGDYVLIHVGFAMSKIDEREAVETLRLLEELGSYQDEFGQFESSPV
jgi:hydrogenase expression/formation protein HypC